ncbi:MAG: hypothetical protein C1943_03860 [Halochromatium sp.]|nr:hypothetical protein [Halochromatium sp.]
MSTTNSSTTPRQSKADQQESMPVAGQIAALKDQIETKVAGLRTKIETIKSKLVDLDEAGVPPDEYLARIAQWIDKQAQSFETDLEYRFSSLRTAAPQGDFVSAFRLRVRGSNDNESIAAADASGMICWLMRDEIKAKLAPLIEGVEYQDGPASADRPRLREKLNAQLDTLELQEEALICEAEPAGIIIPRRIDARPEIILSLQLPEVTA